MAKRMKDNGKVPVILSSEQSKFAVTQITAFAKEAKQLEGGFTNMSNHLLAIAKRAEKDFPNRVADAYVELCKFAETSYKEMNLDKEGNEVAIKKLLPFWPVAKSQVKAGIVAGLKMKDFKTVYEVVEATPKKERTPGGETGANGGAKEGDEGSISMPKGAHGEALATTYTRLNRILRAIVVQRPELIASAAVSVGKLCDELEEMAHVEAEANVKSGKTTDEGAGIPAEQVA